YLHAGERSVVEIVAHDGGGDETGGGAEAGRVIVDAKVVVDRFGDVENLQIVFGAGGQLLHDARGVGGIITADVEEKANIVLLEGGEDFFAIGGVGFIAR